MWTPIDLTIDLHVIIIENPDVIQKGNRNQKRESGSPTKRQLEHILFIAADYSRDQVSSWREKTHRVIM